MNDSPLITGIISYFNRCDVVGRITKMLALAVSYTPISAVRVILYRLFFGYRIRGSKIGYRTIILVNSLDVVDSVIGPRCRFLGPMEVTIDHGRVSGDNTFNCGTWTSEPKFLGSSYDRVLELRNGCLITSGHYFDVVGRFVLGERSWIAGNGSQFWTHGAGVSRRNITIGSDCYIGSAVRFAPGSSVGDCCIVGLGSVVTKEFLEPKTLIGGAPAKVIKSNYDWRSY